MILADAIDDLFWGLVALGFLVGLYFLPTILAISREVPSKWSIAVINAFLGWTLVGWVVALAMAVRTVSSTSISTAVSEPSVDMRPPHRDCPNCNRPIRRDAAVCPHCGSTYSMPWILHAGVWWYRGKSGEWQWLDEKVNTFRWYRDGTPSSPTATDMTPSLAIDPAVVSPPDAPKPEETASPPEPERADSFTKELERLADLYDRGALNDEQFETAKARLLGP